MPTHTASKTQPSVLGMGDRRLRALVAIPIVVLAMSAGVFTAAHQPETTYSAAVCNLPTVPNCAS